MNNITFLCINLTVFLIVIFMFSAVFTIGFFVGYKNEERKICKSKRADYDFSEETEQEKKAKREWNNFLKYDGSVLENNIP